VKGDSPGRQRLGDGSRRSCANHGNRLFLKAVKGYAHAVLPPAVSATVVLKESLKVYYFFFVLADPLVDVFGVAPHLRLVGNPFVRLPVLPELLDGPAVRLNLSPDPGADIGGHGNSSSQTELFLNVRYFDYNVKVCADHLSVRFFVILSVGLPAGDRNPKYNKFGSLSAFGRQKGL
jgi:hypothetical protein